MDCGLKARISRLGTRGGIQSIVDLRMQSVDIFDWRRESGLCGLEAKVS